MYKEGKLFGINIIDLGVILVITLAAIGFILVRSGGVETSANVIEKKSVIEFDVLIRGVKLSRQDRIFNKGDKTFITIRNVPYTSLDIVDSEREQWQLALADPANPSRAIAVDDPTNPYIYNVIVTLKDGAVITPDGPVIGGNKIKIGLPIVLEGFDYRLAGTVSDLRIKD